MKFDHTHYVPCLRWKMGEYQAIAALPDETKENITPLIEVPEIGFDFETEKENKTIDKHLEPIAKRIKIKWGTRDCFVDLDLIKDNLRMPDGSHAVDFVYNQLQAYGCNAIPVTGINRARDFQSKIKETVAKQNRGICLRVSLEEAGNKNLRLKLGELLTFLEINVGDCDFVLDLQCPNFSPLEDFVNFINLIIKRIPNLFHWRTFTLLATSFPSTMGEVHMDATILKRKEWLLYKSLAPLLEASEIRIPTFGDYTINHPDLLRLDMRKVKPSASIRYTINDAWLIIKGKNVRDNGFDQYKTHCGTLLKSSYFAGRTFSEGDNYIYDCGCNGGSTGNLPTWRKVGTNHHLVKVVNDISSFFSS